MNTFTQEQIDIVNSLLAMTPRPLQLVEEDYTSDEEPESDSGCESPPIKRRPGRPKKVRSPEELAAREASKVRGRGRPKVVRTPEQLADIAAAIAAKEVRTKDRQANKVERDEERKRMSLEKTEARQANSEQKALEKAEREIVAKQKRSEIYQTMLAKAEAYKTKWDL